MNTVTCGDGTTPKSCGECPKPTEPNDPNCESANTRDCVVREFTTAINPLNFGNSEQKEYFCTNQIIDEDRKWCHGNNDFLQIDQKTMFDFSDPGSAQNRFCGSDLPRIGGIQNKHFYISEGSQLIIWLKTNSGLKVGNGFQLDWRGYDCPTDKPNIDEGTCKQCPAARPRNNDQTCVATCPYPEKRNDDGTCVTACPPEKFTNVNCVNDSMNMCDTNLSENECVDSCPNSAQFVWTNEFNESFCWFTSCP